MSIDMVVEIDPMLLVGKNIKNLFVHNREPLHSAWVNDPNPDYVSFSVVIQDSEDTLYAFVACEVELMNERYPALGIKLEKSDERALAIPQLDGGIIQLVNVTDNMGILPFKVHSVRKKDAIGEGVINQYEFQSSEGRGFLVRHILPPMLLGVQFVQ